MVYVFLAITGLGISMVAAWLYLRFCRDASITYVTKDEKKIAFRCGHDGHLHYDYVVYGRRMQTDAERIRANPRKCPDCQVEDMRKHIIRCVRCGQPIFPGQAVALYWERRILVRPGVRQIDDGYLGCMDWDCCPCSAHFVGHWTENGLRPLSEHGTVADHVLATGEPVAGVIGPLPGGRATEDENDET